MLKLVLFFMVFFNSTLSLAKTYATGYIPGNHEQMESVAIHPDPTLPESYDWRAKFDLPVKDQGQCGSCWSFATTGIVEAALQLKGTLSEQTMVDCSHYDCRGGDFDALDFVTETGVAKRVDYPYTARNGRCKLKAGMELTKIASWSFIKPATTEAIKTAIMKYGPVAVTVAADSQLMNYESGVYKTCSKRATINHMVILVGWEGDHWIMRNSWGKAWGEDGYMKIIYADRLGHKCNHIADEAAFVVIK